MVSKRLPHPKPLITNHRKGITWRGMLLFFVGMVLFAGSSVACGYAFSRIAPPKVTVIPVLVKECAKGRPA